MSSLPSALALFCALAPAALAAQEPVRIGREVVGRNAVENLVTAPNQNAAAFGGRRVTGMGDNRVDDFGAYSARS